MVKDSQSDYFVEGLFSSNEINLIYGPPGAGKTRLLFMLLQSIHNHSLFLDQFRCDPLSFSYVAYDRSRAKTTKLLAEYGLSDIPWKSLRNITQPSQRDEEIGIDKLPQLFHGSKLIVIDGFGLTIPGGKSNDYNIVGNYLRWCGTIAEQAKVSFIMSLHTPKQKTDSKITNVRQMALGSTIFSGIAEGILYIDSYLPNDSDDPRRIIRLLPHDGKPQTLTYEFNDAGFLIPWHDPAEQTIKIQFYKALPDFFNRSHAVELAEKFEIKERSCDRYLKQWIEEGRLIASKDDWGRTYRKVKVA